MNRDRQLAGKVGNGDKTVSIHTISGDIKISH